MRVLVLNCGSSSIKYQFFDTIERTALAKGVVERIGMSSAVLSHKRYDGDEIKVVVRTMGLFQIKKILKLLGTE